jgi:hypothetical protein
LEVCFFKCNVYRYVAGKTILGRPFKLGNKNLQGCVADMYVYLREQEVTLTRKTKCLLYRAQQVFGFVGAPWTGAMDDKEMAKAGLYKLKSVAPQLESRLVSTLEPTAWFQPWRL